MAIKTIFTRGLGNGTFNGTIAEVVTRGYTIGAEVSLKGREMFAEFKVRSMSAQGVDRLMHHDYEVREMFVL